MTLAREDAAAASARWIWIPEGARTVETDDFLVVRYPDWAFIDLDMPRFAPTGDPDAALDAALEAARSVADGLDPAWVQCWVSLDAPDGHDERLAARGGRHADTLAVLAVDLTDGPPAVEVPDDVEVRWTTTAADLTAFSDVSVEVFGGRPTTPERAASEAEKTVELVADGAGGRALALIDGEPVGCAGLQVVAGDARLWGGAVVESARGRGVYRALLAHRLRYAAERGAALSIVKGMVDTSAPILRRAGFTSFGEERTYRVPLA